MRTRSSRSYAIDEDEKAGRGLLDTIEESFYLDDAESDLSEDARGAAEKHVNSGVIASNEESIPVRPRQKQLIVKLRIPSQNATTTLPPSCGQDFLSEGKQVKTLLSEEDTAHPEPEQTPDTVAWSIVENLSMDKQQILATEQSGQEPIDAGVEAGPVIHDETKVRTELLIEDVLKAQIEGVACLPGPQDVIEQDVIGQEVTQQAEDHVDAVLKMNHDVQEGRQNCEDKTGSSRIEPAAEKSAGSHSEEESVSQEQRDSDKLLVPAITEVSGEVPDDTLPDIDEHGHVESRSEETFLQPVEGLNSAYYSSTNSSHIDDEVWSTETTVESLLPTPPPEMAGAHPSIRPQEPAQQPQHMKQILSRKEVPLAQSQSETRPEKRNLPFEDTLSRPAKRRLPLDDPPDSESKARKRQKRDGRALRHGEEDTEAESQSVKMQDLIEATRGTGVIAAGRVAQRRRGVFPVKDHVAGGRVQKAQKPKPQKPKLPQRAPLSQSGRSNMVEYRKLFSSQRRRGGLNVRSMLPPARRKRNGR